MRHPYLVHYAGAEDVAAEIDAREPDVRDHLAETRAATDAHHPRRLALTVTDVITETPTTATFGLARPDGADLPPFLAGQYVAVFADGTNRPYSLSSSPADLGHYDLTVRRVPGGRISNLLVDTVAPGAELTTTGPMGTFYHNPLFHGDDVVYLAAGSGVVPAMSMIRDIVDRRLGYRFHLLYGSHDAADVIFRAELDTIAARHPNIRVDHVIGSRLTADTIAAVTGPLDGRMVYACGPQGFYPFALDQLGALGHPRRRIRFDANGAPAGPETQPHWPTGVDPAGEVTVTVGRVSFPTPRNRPLLDALEDNGVRPEAACRSGECSLCRIRILGGQVHTASQAHLRASDAASDYVHSCVAYPITDVDIQPSSVAPPASPPMWRSAA
jgi:glycine betaine catabolism B